MSKKDNPLVTFVVFAYNQERYIREAVEAAFLQDYSPLEILLSDDCSSDATFSIMQKMATDYKGPHSIKINRNSQNMGIGGHLNCISELVSGEFIVMQAGDDVSMPNRARDLAGNWLSSGRKNLYVHSDVAEISGDGKYLGARKPRHIKTLNSLDSLISSNPHAIGASEGFSIEIYKKFGDLLPSVTHEDTVLPFRARLIGRCGYVSEPLLYYRTGGISSNYADLTVQDILYNHGVKIAARYAFDYKQKLEDYKKIGADPSVVKALRRKVAEWLLIESFGGAKGVTISAVKDAVSEGCQFVFILKQILKYGFPRIYSKFLAVKG